MQCTSRCYELRCVNTWKCSERRKKRGRNEDDDKETKRSQSFSHLDSSVEVRRYYFYPYVIDKKSWLKSQLLM